MSTMEPRNEWYPGTYTYGGAPVCPVCMRTDCCHGTGCNDPRAERQDEN